MGLARPEYAFRILLALALPSGITPRALAQAGDRAGEVQPDVPAEWMDFESPVLSPDEALAAFEVEPGFRIELVAAEPLVEDPVVIAFDEFGRLWAVEMRGYMPNVDGEGERTPVGRVVLLHDDDGDGRMDRSSVFLDHLTLPRAILPTHGGVLIVEPPNLMFFRDENGDDRADTMLMLDHSFKGMYAVEHAGNALTRGIDNWIHTSQHPARFHFDGERLVQQRKPGHGQWGLAMDDLGRFYYTTNSVGLFCDVVPSHYAARNPNLNALQGVNRRVLQDTRVWPSDLTPGINRGYQPNMLVDGRLRVFTAACGPVIDRGGLFPDSHAGNAYVCEPSGNLIKRAIINETDDGPGGRYAYEGREFLTSTDERFRPVNMVTGPDGALYVVDMYRGILQHRVYVTTFLRKQILARGLDSPLGLGRIWRIVPEDHENAGETMPGEMDDEELVRALSHENGWIRDTAHRLLVERRVVKQADSVRALLQADEVPRVKLHALWTLEGLGELSAGDVSHSLKDPSEFVRATAVQLLEAFRDEPITMDLLWAAVVDESRRVRVQAALALGEFSIVDVAPIMKRCLDRDGTMRPMRAAILSGLADQEHKFLATLLTDSSWIEKKPGRAEFIHEAVDCVLRSRNPEAARELAELAVKRVAVSRWQAAAIVERFEAEARIGAEYPRFVRVDREPDGWMAVATGIDVLGDRFAKLGERLIWPGKPGVDALAPRPMSGAEQELFDHGRRLYSTFCYSCHQSDGRGMAGTAPTLAGSDWVLGDDETLVRILLHGMQGPVTVAGESFDADMPRSPAGSDRDIAAISTYVRRSWGNTADPISPNTVRRVREASRERLMPWTAAELMK